MYVYCPKTYTSPKIKTEGLKQYQEMDGLIRWAVDLGAGWYPPVDITYVHLPQFTFQGTYQTDVPYV